MKLLLFTFIFCIISSLLFAQTDTTKVEQYCELVTQGRFLSNKVTLDINFGEERKFLGGGSIIKDEIIAKVRKFNSISDALNYLGLKGWVLVNAFPLGESSGPRVYHFYFKKLFDKAIVQKAEEE